MTVVSQPREPSAANASKAAPPGSEGQRVGMPPPEKPAAAKRSIDSTIDLARHVRDRQAEVWRYLRFLGADPPEADDLTQETFLAFARSDFVEESDAQTAGYLRTIARRQLLMLRRTQRRRITTIDFDTAETVWAEQMWSHRTNSDGFDDRVEAAKECVEKLDGRARQAIDLSYSGNESRQTIAERLDMKPDGVKTLLRRTRQVLRECIERRLRDVI